MSHLPHLKNWWHDHTGQKLHKMLHNRQLWTLLGILGLVAIVLTVAIWAAHYAEPVDDMGPYRQFYWMP